MNKRRCWRLLAAAACLCVLLAGCGGDETSSPSSAKPTSSADRAQRVRFSASDDYFYNPLMGFVGEADYPVSVGENTLVYIDVLWKDWEPEEGQFAIEALEEANHIADWREQGKHAVIRFLCDKPSRERHMDIPQWLYDKTGDGVFYDYSSKQGYSPDYENPVLIEAHAKAIAALGEHLGQDTFVSYVELGSLGHWGEWHVQYEEGIPRIPKADVREQYVIPYLEAFPRAKMLMRRPFITAKVHGFGLYDDTAAHPESTEEWLDWIANGGDYRQAEEENALAPMADAWKTAPIGGEFNSDLTMEEMLDSGLSQTLSLIRRSHTTFLGPKIPNDRSEEDGAAYPKSIEAILRTMGYRLRVAEAAYTPPKDGKEGSLELIWANDGIAPLYWDWPVSLYFLDSEENVLQTLPVDVAVSTVLPGETVASRTAIPESALEDAAAIAVGIEDPLTGRPAVRLTMEADQAGERLSVLYRLS